MSRAFVSVTALGSVALVLLANASALNAWFAADDFLWLEISRLGDVLRSFTGPWGHGAAWRPLSRVSFYLDYTLFGLDAGPWHLVSLLWHAAATTLLALLLTRLTGDAMFSLIAASVFALLPMQYENTLWISARSHAIALAGSLASLLALERFLQAPTAARLLASGSFLAAALLAYEAPVYTVPLAVLVVLAKGRTIPLRVSIIGLATLAGVVVAYLIARHRILAGGSLYDVRAIGGHPTSAFAGRFVDLGRTMVEQVWPPAWWFVAAGAVSAVTAPRMLVLAGAGALVAGIGYAPFALVDGFGPRFAYASQAGLAMMLAAAVTGLSRLGYVGRPLAALLLSLLLVHELRATQQIAREFQVAGAIGRQSLERLTAGWPEPDPDRPAVILGAPTGHGRAMIFFTYFDLALGTFHPGYAGLRIPGHVLTDFRPGVSHAIAVDAWRREQQRRRRHGLPELTCRRGRRPDRTRDVDGFVRALLDCGAVFYAIDRRNFAAYQVTPAFVEARLARGWRTP